MAGGLPRVECPEILAGFEKTERKMQKAQKDARGAKKKNVSWDSVLARPSVF
jgi:hypothetical protein